MDELKDEAYDIMLELIEKSELEEGSLIVVGCSTSEVIGGIIGTNSSIEAAAYVFNGIYKAILEKKMYLAAQCCEHLNRALIIEKSVSVKRGYELVAVKPQPKAGGSFSTTAYKTFKEPVVVENVRAEAGIDIGGTLIGMHLKAVAVPIRLSKKKLGHASIICAKTRPKYIGGERACY